MDDIVYKQSFVGVRYGVHAYQLYETGGLGSTLSVVDLI